MVWAMTIRSMLLGALAMLSGCASVSTMGLARTLNKGAVQGWVAPSGGGIVATTGVSPGSVGAGIGYPLIEGGVRVGVTDHFELGGKLGFSGIGLEGKGALVRSESMESGVNVSLNPGVTFVGIGSGDLFLGTVTFHLPVLIGIDFAGHELVIGPRLIDQLFLGGAGATGASINVLYAGGSLGIAIKLLPGLRLLPEVAFGVPFLVTGSATGVGTASQLGGGGLIFQAGLGFLFGSPDQYERREVLPMSPPPLPPAAPLSPPAAPPPNAL
jgi:hypothetical protein